MSAQLRSSRPLSLSALAFLFALLAAAPRLADAAPHSVGATVFREGKRTVPLTETFKLSRPVVRGQDGAGRIDVNVGLANTETLEFLNDSSAGSLLIPQTVLDSENLPLKRVHRSQEGFTLRFGQRFHRVKIDGAELLAIFNAEGTLIALNSSLRFVNDPRLTVTPTLSREAAFAQAVRQARYDDPETPTDDRDSGLLLVRDPRRPGHLTLVWQFHVREHADGSRPSRLRVAATGSQAGTLLENLSLVHSLRTPVSIYDASVTLVVPNPLYKGVKVLEDGRPTLAGRVLPLEEASHANQVFQTTLGFYRTHFQRESYDGNGAEISASVNVQKIGFVDLLGQKENAAWMAPWKMFVFGAGGEELGGFASALDVVGHEYTHAVVSSTSNLEYAGQSGALNEHLADVFGEMIEMSEGMNGRPFLLGESVLRGALKRQFEALRDMLFPEKGVTEQPGTMSQIPPSLGADCRPSGTNDNCGVHILSGIPNRIIARVAQAHGWEPIRALVYQVMTSRLRSSSDFRDYRHQMLFECEQPKPPLTQAVCESIRAQFDEAGIEN